MHYTIIRHTQIEDEVEYEVEDEVEDEVEYEVEDETEVEDKLSLNDDEDVDDVRGKKCVIPHNEKNLK